MRFEDYEVTIPQAVEDHGYSILKDRQEYSIKITNYGRVRCNAKIQLDGKDIGTFRLEAGQSSNLEHPVQYQNRFVFCVEGTLKARIAGIGDVPPALLGLLKVTFLPEKIESGNVLAGVTGKGSISNQIYGVAEPINVDEDRAATIYLRLVGVTPKSYNPPRPRPRETTMPPPIKPEGSK